MRQRQVDLDASAVADFGTEKKRQTCPLRLISERSHLRLKNYLGCSRLLRSMSSDAFSEGCVYCELSSILSFPNSIALSGHHCMQPKQYSQLFPKDGLPSIFIFCVGQILAQMPQAVQASVTFFLFAPKSVLMPHHAILSMGKSLSFCFRLVFLADISALKAATCFCGKHLLIFGEGVLKAIQLSA